MPTAPSVARPSPPAASRPPIHSALAAIGAMAAIPLLVAISTVLRGPERVDVVVENPTIYDLDVRVAPADGGSAFGLGTVQPESTRTFTGVIDQGDRWLVEAAYAGMVAAEFTISGADVEASGIVVPPQAEQALRDAGITPPP